MYSVIRAPRIPLNRNVTPRQAIKTDSGNTLDLPIRGGWGYDLDDAVVIEGLDPSISESQPWNAFRVQERFAEQRFEFELRQVFPDQDADLQYKRISQRLVKWQCREFDVFKYRVFLEPWEHLWLDPETQAPIPTRDGYKYTAILFFDISIFQEPQTFLSHDNRLLRNERAEI